MGSMMTVVNGNPASEMECNTAAAEDRPITPIPSYSKKQEKIDTASKRDLSPNTCMWVLKKCYILKDIGNTGSFFSVSHKSFITKSVWLFLGL